MFTLSSLKKKPTNIKSLETIEMSRKPLVSKNSKTFRIPKYDIPFKTRELVPIFGVTNTVPPSKTFLIMSQKIKPFVGK